MLLLCLCLYNSQMKLLTDLENSVDASLDTINLEKRDIQIQRAQLAVLQQQDVPRP